MSKKEYKKSKNKQIVSGGRYHLLYLFKENTYNLLLVSDGPHR